MHSDLDWIDFSRVFPLFLFLSALCLQSSRLYSSYFSSSHINRMVNFKLPNFVLFYLLNNDVLREKHFFNLRHLFDKRAELDLRWTKVFYHIFLFVWWEVGDFSWNQYGGSWEVFNGLEFLQLPRPTPGAEMLRVLFEWPRMGKKQISNMFHFKRI